MKKKILFGLLVFTLVALPLFGACAEPAPPAPAPPTPAPVAPPVEPPEVDPLAQLIEAARAEGKAFVRINPEVDEDEMKRLEYEIEETFGVKLELINQYVGPPSVALSKLYMELAAGVTPHLDLMWSSAVYSFMPEWLAITKEIDWHALLTEDMNPAVVQDHLPVPSISWGDALYTIMYRTDKLSADEVPTTWTGLADPKLRGVVGIPNYASAIVDYAYQSGDKEEVLSGIRACLANDAFLGRYGDIMARIELGEIWVGGTVTHRFLMSRERGVPLATALMYDTVVLNAYATVVVKGAKHTNAATLVLLYLSSPEGSKWQEDTWGCSTRHYPGSWVYDTVAQAERDGLPIIDVNKWTEYVEFLLSPEIDMWTEEASAILAGE